jgi:hypothetical protein
MVLFALTALVTPDDALAITLFTDASVFQAHTGAITIPIPRSAVAFPGTLCGAGDIGPTGIGPSVTMGFSSSSVTISGAGGNDLCIFDAGTVIRPFGNTVPDTMVANTIVGNGEDDFLLTFNDPIQAIGLRLLTNFLADETVTFRDADGHIIETVDIDPLTPTNARVFVGFASSVPFKTVLLDTDDGDSQNEGIEGIMAAAQIPSPVAVGQPATLVLLGAGLMSVGLRRQKATPAR